MNTYYFFEASPIKEVSSLNIGSRPTARKIITEISGLRAIPGIFSWLIKTVSCLQVIWWGSATATFLEEGNLEKLQHMFRVDALFFRSLLSVTWCFQNQIIRSTMHNYESSCSQCLHIIFDEWQLTKDAVFLVIGKI